ncbi:hypothetical protein JCM11641_005284 [Rhodosporidiobolus odoratus]
MASAPVPYAPETSEAPHEGPLVSPLVDTPTETSAKTDASTSGEDGLSERSTPHLNGQDSASSIDALDTGGTAASATVPGASSAKGDFDKGEEERDLRAAIQARRRLLQTPSSLTGRARMTLRVRLSGFVAVFTLLAPLSSSMIAPAAPQVAAKLNIADEVEISMTVSIFSLAFAISPLVFRPASELWGRVRMLQIADIFYVSDFGGDAPLSIGAGVLSDLWRPEEREKGAALYSLGPLLGPAMGPVMGGWVTDKLPNDGYKVIFYTTSAFSAVVQVIGFFSLMETYAPVLLSRRAHTLKKPVGLPADSSRVNTTYEAKAGGKKTPKEVVKHGMPRPFTLFVREPILQILALFMSLMYDVVYILITSPSSIYQGIYGQSVGIASLHFIALMLGFFLASQVAARLLEVLYRKLKAKEGNGRPEFTLPLLVPASLLLPLGLLLYGWCAEKRLHWIAPDIVLFLIGLSMISIFQSITTSLLDAFTLYAASALAATTCLRSICGFCLSLMCTL